MKIEIGSPDEDKASESACTHCGEDIEGQGLYPWRDICLKDGALVYVDDPDGPFCDVDCRRAYDAEQAGG